MSKLIMRSIVTAIRYGSTTTKELYGNFKTVGKSLSEINKQFLFTDILQIAPSKISEEHFLFIPKLGLIGEVEAERLLIKNQN